MTRLPADEGESATGGAGVGGSGARIAAALKDGRAFTVLVAADPAECAQTVREAVGALEAEGAMVTTVGNPLRSPLTVERLIIQIDEGDGSEPREVIEEAARSGFAGHGRAVLVVEQADTLDEKATAFLSQLSSTLRRNGAEFQILFAGREPLADMLARHGFPSAAVSSVAKPAVASIEGWQVTPANRPAAPPAKRSGLAWAGGAAAGVAAAAAVAFALPPGVMSRRPDRAVPALAGAPVPPRGAAEFPAPDAAQPESPLLPATPPAAPVAPSDPTAAPSQQPTSGAASAEPDPSPERLAALRRDFDAFIDRSGDKFSRLTGPQREALFADYLAWRSRIGDADPAAR